MDYQPMYFVRSGDIGRTTGSLRFAGSYSGYWSRSTYPQSITTAYRLTFTTDSVYPFYRSNRYAAFSARCFASLSAKGSKGIILRRLKLAFLAENCRFFRRDNSHHQVAKLYLRPKPLQHKSSEATFYFLLHAYGYPETGEIGKGQPNGWTVSNGSPYTSITNTKEAIVDYEPIHFVRSGNVDRTIGSLRVAGNASYYWSRSAYPKSSTHAYALHFNAGNVFPSNLNYRDLGFSARCRTNSGSEARY